MVIRQEYPSGVPDGVWDWEGVDWGAGYTSWWYCTTFCYQRGWGNGNSKKEETCELFHDGDVEDYFENIYVGIVVGK